MDWDIVAIEQDEALRFLRENHADREVIFIRGCDEWIAVYDDNVLAGVTGINHKKADDSLMSVDCSYVRKDYRGKGILKAFYAWIMEQYPDCDWVIYCRPIAAHVVKKYYNFIVTQTWKNGTEKCVLKRKK